MTYSPVQTIGAAFVALGLGARRRPSRALFLYPIGARTIGKDLMGFPHQLTRSHGVARLEGELLALTGRNRDLPIDRDRLSAVALDVTSCCGENGYARRDF